ncbi:hypothetical protein B0I33_109222 [Prauserella shujinwangii]|uniref:DUF3093 family protein n=1 Tax=Prauserella shujinwangii TaxID=1453103 RepID=A0A2T0LQF3_9PSEU|nr:DUF3093 family protein [Prauserella shujinwangii]PRX45559.1 hypothetical protein B0I33_109222 [Prauserella shujinwangii]
MSVLYREPGASGWPVLWGPLFAAAGYLLELLAGDRPHTLLWVFVAAGLSLFFAAWVFARRRFLAVAVTDTELRQGAERLPVERIESASDVPTPLGTRVLGGSWSVPRKYTELPLRLDDGTVVLAWARDPERLRAALERARRT